MTIDLENSELTKENEEISEPKEKNGFSSVNTLQRIFKSTPKHILNGVKKEKSVYTWMYFPMIFPSNAANIFSSFEIFSNS